MGSLNFDNLEKVVSTSARESFTYADLHLDIEETTVKADRTTRAKQGKDIRTSYDEEAIKNSIVNILNTIPGERFLVPEFGASLTDLVFRPITDMTARVIGDRIFDAIDRFEPRVNIENISVVGIADIHQYNIEIRIRIPTLTRSKVVNLTTTLSQEGFLVTS
jgi:phage baseplate assembly protein W